jgi:hypothetical protein
MAHFAEIDETNVVIRVLVVDDLHEDDGQNYLANVLGLGGTWIKTSYNTVGNKHLLEGEPLRGNFAGAGYLYDPIKDVFIAPKPFDSWVLSEDTFAWEAPTPKPNDGKIYLWDEDRQIWHEPEAS